MPLDASLEAHIAYNKHRSNYVEDLQVTSFRTLGRRAAHRTRDSISGLFPTRKTKCPCPQQHPTMPVPRRPLTPPLSGAATAQETPFNQPQSPFFKLPFELREEIYTQVIGRSNIHITHAITLHHLRCKCASCPGYVSYWDYGYAWRRTWACDRTKYDYDGDSISIAFLMSCRRAYTEATRLLYSSNTFTFQDENVLCRFLDHISPPRRDCLRSIHMDLPPSSLDHDSPDFGSFRNIACNVLVGLPNLRFLEFRIHPLPNSRSTTYVADLSPLAGLVQISSLQVVRLYISVPSEAPAWMFERPFEILPLYIWDWWERRDAPNPSFVF